MKVFSIFLGLFLLSMSPHTYAAAHAWTGYGVIDRYTVFENSDNISILFKTANTANPYGICAVPETMILRIDNTDPSNAVMVSQVLTAAATGSEVNFHISGTSCGSSTQDNYTLIRGVRLKY